MKSFWPLASHVALPRRRHVLARQSGVTPTAARTWAPPTGGQQKISKTSPEKPYHCRAMPNQRIEDGRCRQPRDPNVVPMPANGATTTYGKERILAKPRFVNQTQPIEDGPPNIKMEGNDRQQANKDNITRRTNLENTTSSANVVRTVEPQTSMFASAERLSK
ncbi:hypothetical protein Bbelb_418760 [Branchiostoma belcheri]|nr:hypothetical protein Bbelb_418760 [Branchiostoma belcheri]